MAQTEYRVNLTAEGFPIMAQNMGRTVVIGGQDQAYIGGSSSQLNPQPDKGIPQVYYGHNIMPTVQGYQSVGFTKIIDGVVGSTFLPNARSCRPKFGFLQYDLATGDLYYVSPGTFGTYPKAWTLGLNMGIPPSYTGTDLTVAHVGGVTYFYVGSLECRNIYIQFSPPAVSEFISGAVTLVGLVAADIEGILAVSGYMIAWDRFNRVYWSSLLDPTDFTPSLATGAGSQLIESLRGSIITIEKLGSGFIVYGEQNAVAATYTQNARYPFQFRELISSGGIKTRQQVGYGANDDTHYILSSYGIQKITANTVNNLFPEIVETICAQRFENFDAATNTFSYLTSSGNFDAALNVVGARYIIVSYAPKQSATVKTYQFALIYDTAIGRWGKVKFDHADIIEWINEDSSQAMKNVIGFMQIDGSVYLMDFSLSATAEDSVLILGKYQNIRDRFMALETVAVDNVDSGATFSLTDLYTLDGKTFLQATPTLLSSSSETRNYGFHVTGMNHSLLFKGTFNLTGTYFVTRNHGRF